jgi:hypothetical protein
MKLLYVFKERAGARLAVSKLVGDFWPDSSLGREAKSKSLLETGTPPRAGRSPLTQ